MAILATDDFNGASNADLGAQWDPCTGESGPNGFILTGSGSAGPSGGGGSDCSETNNAVTWPNDHYSEITFFATGANGAGSGCGVTCRAATGATVTYYRLIGNASGYELGKKVAGSFTSLSSGTGTTFTAGDKMRLQLSGTTWTCFKNGVQFATGTDSAIASGRAGIAYSSTDGTTTIDAFEGGSLVSSSAVVGRGGGGSPGISGPF